VTNIVDNPLPVTLVGAHGGYGPLRAPLGGGATIFECLIEAWRNRNDVKLKILSPGPAYSALHPFLIDYARIHPASLGYFSYARFCRKFENATTRLLTSKAVSGHPWVVVNDLSESPTISKLKAHGYRVMTLVHVDVVAFISNMYLRGSISPPTLASYWRKASSVGLNFITPDILKLIFEKQEQAYELSDVVIVPSAPMKQTILDCYPSLKTRVEVVPWGNPTLTAAEVPPNSIIAHWKKSHGIDEQDFILLSLCRISPEKGIDRTLVALRHLEALDKNLAARLHFVIAGSAAYMDGPRYLKRLQNLAAQLRAVRVHFVGHLTGEDKACAFASANLYGLMSYHESFGLTLSEALSSGIPAFVSKAVAQKQTTPEGIVFAGDLPEELAQFFKKWFDGKVPRPTFSPPDNFSSAADKLLNLLRN
jgi:glycosyltransferase involved in cell wall biosynthesis